MYELSIHACVRVTKNGCNSDLELPEIIALRRESCRLANNILDDIRDRKYNNAEQFNTAYMELCGLLALDDAQV